MTGAGVALPAIGEALPAAPASAEVLRFLARRRSLVVREQTAPGPSAAELSELLQVGLRVPDHGKLEPWRLVVLEGEDRWRLGAVIRTAFAARQPDATAASLEVEAGRLARAPLVIAVISAPVPSAKIPEWEQILSAGALCHQLLLAANAMGFAAQWLTEWYAYDAAVTAALGCREGERIAGFIHIGTAKGPAEERKRPELAAKASRLEGPLLPAGDDDGAGRNGAGR
ncbi:MAG: nitroreductase [Geminicoccaceae bacterium]|nr:MAG: nitroreductase [Geminicoccaceae bacterium]